MTEIIVRKATAADIDVLLQFEQGIIKFERPFDSTLKDDPINYYDLQALIASTEAEVIIAEGKNKEIIASGYALIKNAKVYETHERYAYLGCMFVSPHLRGQGVNKMIIDSLIQWAYSKEIKEVRLEVYAENANAIKAYAKVGFKPHMLEMRLITPK